MAQTIGQHGVAAFTSPVNGDLLNATVVTGNDNTTRSAYVDHDSDSGIHVQSSLLAARPAAGTAGRKWMTTDTGAVKLWFDTGAAWEEIAYISSTGGTVAGALTVTGLITATGGVSGNVTGAVTGNASTATTLQTSRNINGVAFNGSADITITAVADASTLTGATLASNVLASSLTSVGALNAGSISSGFGAIDIGTDAFTGAGTGLTGTAAGLTAGGNALLTANTFTAAQEWATGTSIASAATINLDTATGNRVHITGTTAITAVTLTRGPRTVIFDGILTLTHNATTNNLPSAANITTAVGDRAVYESDGTTVYCVSYIRANGQAVVGTSSASVVNYPQSIKSVDYTLVLGDAGYQIFHPASDTAARVFTIPANSSVAYPIGTVLVFVNEAGAKGLSVAITTDTLRSTLLTTGTQKVPAGNMLTAMKIAATTWLCWPATPLSLSRSVAVGYNTSPFVSVYPWSSVGFGTKFPDPATTPTGTGNGVAFSPSGTEFAVAHSTSPFVSAYPWSGSGFGTKFTNPATLPTGIGNGVAFSPNGTELAVAHDTSPRISAYPWSSAGFGTKFTNPATLPTSEGRGVAFSPDGTALAVAHQTSPNVSVYPWSSAGFGTKYANPATLPTGEGRGVAFSPAGTEIAVAHFTTPFVSAYPWSGAGFGTKFTNPATLPTNNAYSIAFSPDGTALAVGHFTSPYVTAYPWSSAGFGTKYTNPATGVGAGSVGYGVRFSPNGTEIAVSHDTTPFVGAYQWSSSAGFGTKYANPATLPVSDSSAVAFSPI